MVLCDPEKQRGYKTAQFVARWADKAGLNTRLISSYVTSPSCKASDKASQKSIPVGEHFSQTEATLPRRGLLSFPLGVFKPLRDSDHLNRKLFRFLNDFFFFLRKEKGPRKDAAFLTSNPSNTHLVTQKETRLQELTPIGVCLLCSPPADCAVLTLCFSLTLLCILFPASQPSDRTQETPAHSCLY